MKKEIKKYLEKNKFHKQFVYSFLPIITFESANYCYVKNPLVEKFGIKNLPGFIVVWKNNYEDWGDGNIEKITDGKTINLIVKENRVVIRKYKNRANEFLNLDYKKLTNRQLILILEEIDKILIETYHRYIFLIHDYFETGNKRMVELLPKVRVEMSDFVEELYKTIDKIIDALADRFSKIKWQTFMYATINEIIGLLQNPGAKDEFKKIYKRHLVFIFDGRKSHTIKDQKEVKKIVTYLKKQEKKIGKMEEIRGNVAFRGIIKGEVFKISEFDYEKIGKKTKGKKDYILVAPMTRPEFLPYIKKCKAIVTDEGGITCHAAIVSRELKKPCIIGAKIATRFLKDGQLVEVDANKGIVRILDKR